MTKTRKSAFDLTNPAYLKVPRDIYTKLVDQAGENSHWSEVARSILNWWVGDQEEDKPE